MEEEKLFKSAGVFWELIDIHGHGNEFIGENPYCSNDTCRTFLEQKNLGTSGTGFYKHGWHCCGCGKDYECPGNDYHGLVEQVRRKYQGYKRLKHKIYSLDLAPTKVVDNAEDENYWVQARISEKSGKRIAVIYFGERIKGEQNKKDYSQIFLDFEDEQLRFDKNNKNPMKFLSRLEAEFSDSNIIIAKKK